MKRLCAMLISFCLLSSFMLFSCDQESVNSMQSDILDKASDYLEPFFKETSSSTDDSSTYDEEADDQNTAVTPPSKAGTATGVIDTNAPYDQE